MILKELDSFCSKDKYRIAGRKAEEQMAFYLKRYFKTAEDVFVINGLRIWIDGDTAQIDHLVIYPAGIIIIESKSVAEKIGVTNDLQWMRQYGDKRSGMKSPIIQAKMQGKLITELIESSAKPAKHLIENIAVLIAISDSGLIEWPDSGPIDCVKKADQICEEIIRICVANFASEDALISYDEMLKHVTPATWSLTDVVTRGWWSLICACFLIDCDAVHDEVKADAVGGSSDFARSLYAAIWERNVETGLGPIHTAITANFQRRLADIRKGQPTVRRPSISIRRV